MRLARVILRVADMDRAVRFWSETVGLEIVFGSPTFTFMVAGGTQLLLNQVDGSADPGSTELVFEVDDVETEYQRLSERGVPFEVEPRPVTVLSTSGAS